MVLRNNLPGEDILKGPTWYRTGTDVPDILLTVDHIPLLSLVRSADLLLDGLFTMAKLILVFLPLFFIHAQTLGADRLTRIGLSSRVPPISARSAVIQSRVLPKILSDSNWETTVVLFNTGSALVAFQQFFYEAGGKPLSYAIRAQAASEDITTSAIQGLLAPGASLRFVLSDASGGGRQGWSLLNYEDGPGVIDGYVIIRRRLSTAGLNPEANVPFSSLRDSSVYLPFDNTGGFRSQVTLVNPAADLASQVRLTYLDAQGQVLFIDSLTLRPAQQMTLVLLDTYPDLANKSGSVLVEADIDQFAVTGLRCNDAYGTIMALPSLPRGTSTAQ